MHTYILKIALRTIDFVNSLQFFFQLTFQSSEQPLPCLSVVFKHITCSKSYLHFNSCLAYSQFMWWLRPCGEVHCVPVHRAAGKRGCPPPVVRKVFAAGDGY